VTVSADPDTEYTLSGYIKTESVETLDDTGQDIPPEVPFGALLSAGNIANSTYPDLTMEALTDPLTGDNGWTEVSTTFNTGDATEVEVLGLFGGYGEATGTARYDDLRLEGPDGNNLLPNPGFENGSGGGT
jgi:hypothetical protein